MERFRRLLLISLISAIVSPTIAQDSLETLLKKVENEPENSEAKDKLAGAYVKQADKEFAAGRQKTAFESYKKAIQVAPNHPKASERYWELKDKTLHDNGTGRFPAVPKRESSATATSKRKHSVIAYSSDNGTPRIQALETRVFEKLEALKRQNDENTRTIQEAMGLVRSAMAGRHDSPIIHVLVTIVVTFAFFAFGMLAYMLIARHGQSAAAIPIVGPSEIRLANSLETLAHDLKLQIISGAEEGWRSGKLSEHSFGNIVQQFIRDREPDIAEKAASLQNRTKRSAGIRENTQTIAAEPGVTSANADFFRLLPFSVLEAAGVLIDVKTSRPDHHRLSAELAVKIATKLAYAPHEVEMIRAAALIHDIGMLELDDDFFSKQDIYDDAQLDYLRTHPERGAALAKMKPMPQIIREIIAQHHERFDGSGYPKSLKGNRISEGALIVGCAETFVALTSHRPYRATLSPAAALHLMTEAEKNTFPAKILVVLKHVAGAEG